ncbi:hypothetical protein GS682_07545 [Nostoc sp. B(2019)]|nr:hypothetical protein [Nostoc sp. B(2019)]
MAGGDLKPKIGVLGDRLHGCHSKLGSGICLRLTMKDLPPLTQITSKEKPK